MKRRRIKGKKLISKKLTEVKHILTGEKND